LEIAMRSVAIAEAKNHLSELVAAAVAGEEIVITRHGKPAVRLVAAVEDRAARQREVIDRMFALGQAHLRKYGPTTAEEIIEWKNEGRR